MNGVMQLWIEIWSHELTFSEDFERKFRGITR